MPRLASFTAWNQTLNVKSYFLNLFFEKFTIFDNRQTDSPKDLNVFIGFKGHQNV